jgi:hypothetical protein
MIQVLVILRYLIVFISVFFGFYYLDNNPEYAMRIVTGGLVGLVGLLSFVTHVIFHKADAARLGWTTDRPDWQFEVGFANLAFGLTALFSLANVFCNTSRVIIVTAYGLYLFQAALLHGFRALRSKPVNIRKLVLSALLTLVFVAFMAFFAYMSLY